MIVLDTDHLTVHSFRESKAFETLWTKMQQSAEEFATTIISLEEQFRGRLASIKRKSDVGDQVHDYDQLVKLWNYLHDWKILRFDDQAANLFKTFRKKKVRIGSQDLKIAAIALTQDALLLSANLRDFRRVPGLRVESWLSGA
jgi:tRNA(fMet)-specific endonuclease VapC